MSEPELSPELLAGEDFVDFKALGFVEEERDIDAAGEKAVEVGLIVAADDEDVLLGGDAVVFVVDHGLVAVKGESVDHVALDVLDGDEADSGGVLSDFLGERACGVVEV